MNELRSMKYVSTASATPFNDNNASHLGWRSPALYLFIGVAAMLALIGFASLILVCTWFRMVSVSLNQRQTLSPVKPEVTCCHDEEQSEKVLVIMPGEHKPTFLATQLSSSLSHSNVENA